MKTEPDDPQCDYDHQETVQFSASDVESKTLVTSEQDEEVPVVKLQPLDITEQFIDQKGVIYDRESFLIENEKVATKIENEEVASKPECQTEKVPIPIVSDSSSAGCSKTPDDVMVPEEYKCPSCENFSTKYKNNLKKHIKVVHLDMKESNCHLCDYRAGDKSSLQEHIDAVHLKKKEFECDLCTFSTSRERNLKRHKLNIHSPNADKKKHKGKFKCEICEYEAGEKSTLRVHIESVHLNIKNEKCHLCDFSARLYKDVKIHINSVHLKLRNFKCDLCLLIAHPERKPLDPY